MGVLTDKAVLQLVVDAAQGVETMEEFQAKFGAGLRAMGVEADEAGAELETVTDAAQEASVAADELSVSAEGAAVELDHVGSGASSGARELKAFASILDLVDPKLASNLRQSANAAEGAKRLGEASKAASGGLDAAGTSAAVTAAQLGKLLGILGLVVSVLKLTYDATRSVIDGLEKVGVNVDELVAKLPAVKAFGDAVGNLRPTLDDVREGGDLLSIAWRVLSRAQSDAKANAEALTPAMWEQDAALRAQAVAAREAEKAAAALAATGEEDLLPSFEEIEALEEDVEKATTSTTKAVEKQGDAYGELNKVLDATISQLRDAERALRESVRTQRDALGVDDLEQSQADLREEIERLENAAFLTVEEMDRLDRVKADLLQTTRKLEDAINDSTIAYDEHELANVEAELAAAEFEQRQRQLGEAIGDTSGALGDYTEKQEEATSATEKQTEEANKLATALESAVTRAKAAQDAMIAMATAVGAAWAAELDRAIEKIKEAKKCMADLGGTTDDV